MVMTTITAPTEARADTSTSSILEIPLTMAVRSAAAMLAVIQDDKLTPILNAARFDGEQLLATDRYRIARYPIPALPAQSDDRLVRTGDMLIPTEALRWVTRVKPDRDKAKLRLATMSDGGYSIRYTATDGAVTVELVDLFGLTEQTEAFRSPAGTFPPIELILAKPFTDLSVDAEVSYDPKLLGGILAWAAKYGNGAPVKMRATTSENALGETPGPTTITCEDVTFLICPVQPRR